MFVVATVFDPDSTAVKKLLSNMRSSWKMRLFFFQKLPSMWFWRVKVKEITPERCSVQMRYGWTNQNPFGSQYFAAQAGAAEFTTGALALLAQAGGRKFGMLVTDLQCEFGKRAVGTVTFTCEDGKKIIAAAEETLRTGEAVKIQAVSTGRDEVGDVVSVTRVTWSLKRKGKL